jgi:hypothetical protein
MATFDAELYLRLAGERMLVTRGDSGHRWESPIAGAARALVAIGALGADEARSVVDDYDLAMSLRSGNAARYRGMRQRHEPFRAPFAFEPRRTVPIDRTIETACWTMQLQHASFSASGDQNRWPSRSTSPAGQLRPATDRTSIAPSSDSFTARPRVVCSSIFSHEQRLSTDTNPCRS